MTLLFFPDRLTANGGSIRFIVSDNSLPTDAESKGNTCQIIGDVGRSGLSKHLSVDLVLDFEPFEYQDETIRCSMTVRNIPWNSAYRHWWQLVGMNRKVLNGEDGIEGVFYADKPYVIDQIEYSFRYIRENLFELTVTMALGTEGDSQITVQGKAVVPFEGVFIGNGFCRVRASHEIEMSVFESTSSTDAQGIEYYKPRWDNLANWVVRTIITKPPECLSEFRAKAVPIDAIGLEPAWDCTAYTLACSCGAERLDILYRQCPDDPRFEGVVLDPISTRCPDCGKEAVLFDSTKDGYNAKIDSVSIMQGTSDPVAWKCPSCQSPGRVIVVYSHTWDDGEDIPEDIADWFDWFTLKHQCTKSHELHDVGDWECA